MKFSISTIAIALLLVVTSDIAESRLKGERKLASTTEAENDERRDLGVLEAAMAAKRHNDEVHAHMNGMADTPDRSFLDLDNEQSRVVSDTILEHNVHPEPDLTKSSTHLIVETENGYSQGEVSHATQEEVEILVENKETFDVAEAAYVEARDALSHTVEQVRSENEGY